MDDDSKGTIRLQGSISKGGGYVNLRDKLPTSAGDGNSNLLRALIDDWKRLCQLEEMRATGQYPGKSSEIE